jgi:hypothetical protein
MSTKFKMTILFGIICLTISGCLYRGEGVFKQVGDSDYKLRVNALGLLAVADGRPTYVNGTVLLEDHITPLKNVHILLKKNDLRTIASNSYTDHVGAYNMSGILQNETYVIEIDSPEYRGSKEIMVKPNRDNLHEIIAYKR